MVGRPSGRRVLREGERGHAPVVHAAHLLGGEGRIPQRDQHQRDVATGRRAAPLLDQPVVVDLQALEPELAVAGLHEQLAAEPGDRREAERGEDAGAVHVLEAGLRVVAAGPHLGVRQRRGAELLLGPPDDRAETRARVVLAVVDPALHAVAHLHVGRLVAVLGRDPVDPQVRGLEDVVVDRDQPVEVAVVVITVSFIEALRSPCASPLGTRGCPRARARGRGRSACSRRPARRR